jgi:hypothetical protein
MTTLANQALETNPNSALLRRDCSAFRRDSESNPEVLEVLDEALTQISQTA